MTNSNAELQLARDFVQDTGCHVFLTGKAGTGKTTFLHALKKNSPKRMVVTAPTGVAAVNAGGVTLHSFFQLPFGPFVPGSEATRSQYRFGREKIGIIKSLDLLVIDEMSMVRADLLDGVDSVLRRYRRSDQPFGGVQLLMIGDMFQLPPVVKEAEWRLLRESYDSPYFFSSNALQKTEMVTIQLQHVYRQEDDRFIGLLNRVRNNRLDASVLEALNTRYVDGFVPEESDGYITLCTHNRKADTINDARLGALSKKAHRFRAEIEGDFPEHLYPTAANLELKIGAQVMFVRNDFSPEKRYFNGKIGVVTRFSGKDIWIRCPEDDEEIVVGPATWENIDYSLDRNTLEISENKIGSFSQYPLKLAWAITIHKSQGLTFDRAVIDAQAAFAHGQVYVALSRCRTLEGMVLSTPLSSRAMKTDTAVLHFTAEGTQNTPSADQLEAAKKGYQQQVLMECFDFQRLRFLLGRMVSLVLGNRDLIRVSGVEDIRDLLKETEREICTVGDKFLRQLRGLFSDSGLPETDPAILERVTKASAYFQEKIETGPGRVVPYLQIDTDNKEIRKKTKNALKLLQEELAVKRAAVQSCEQGFSLSRYFRAVSTAEIATGEKKEKTKAPAFSESDIAHPGLYRTLKDWRRRKAKEEGIPPFRVMHQKTLIQIAVHLPDALQELTRIRGIGERLAQRYGEELVAMVCAYRSQNQIEEVALPEPAPAVEEARKPKAPRIDTKTISLELFEKGRTLSQIAEERGLALSTIEGHMVHWVEEGKVAIDAVLSSEKRQTIEQKLSDMPETPLGEIKQALGDDVSYGEIKLVQAHFKNSQSS